MNRSLVDDDYRRDTQWVLKHEHMSPHRSDAYSRYTLQTGKDNSKRNKKRKEKECLIIH